ncbi:MAG: serine hydrolase [Candidatus Levyibacteriota bacterium]|jgi:D-alanyl-D-alanine carboxypeptidase (penicillin-binding protein 5/6)
MKGFQIPNKTPKPTFWLLAPLFLALVLVCLVLSFVITKLWIAQNKILPAPFKISQEAKMPLIKTDFVPEISATGALIMDADSKMVLYSKNPDLRFSTASTIKIMTALVALDHFRLSDVLTVDNPSDDGSVLGLVQDEKMTFENLLYAMLLPSANDAALTIAQNYPGGQSAFVKAMNDKAETLELYNTQYADPAGLADEGDYTTPFDLARLASFAMQNAEFRKIVGTKEITISDVSDSHVYDLQNLNILLGQDGVNGVKTGYTEEAGQVLVTSKEDQGKTIIIVVMGSDDRFTDTQILLDLVSNNLTYLSIHP